MQSEPQSPQRAVMLLVAVSLFACPLAGTAVMGAGERAYAEGEARQIQFTPNMATLKVQSTPQPTPVATIGPGAYFEGSDPKRPEVEYIEGGDGQFGYGPLKDHPDYTPHG